MSTTRGELDYFLSRYLETATFTDYGPNGLQIEGKEEIKKVAFAVSATKESAKAACQWNADALIVHHGLFWSFHGNKTLTGPFAKRVFPLVKNDISLFAYHLPLDAHFEVGNAATVAGKIGLVSLESFGDYKGSSTGIKGKFKMPIVIKDLKESLTNIFNKNVLLASPDENSTVENMAIITGGANSEWALAKKEGLDCYLTGEMSEHDWHESQEAGIHMFAGGHHATEQFGIQALMEKLSKTFKIEVNYFDSKNPA